MKYFRLFLIPWIFQFYFLFETNAQQVNVPDLQKLMQYPHRPLYELIPPLDGFRALHQAVAITPPTIENQLIALQNLQKTITPLPSIFNPNKMFLTVTVPNPLYRPDTSSENFDNVVPVAVPPPKVVVPVPETEDRTPDAVPQALPKALSSTIFGGTKKEQKLAGESGTTKFPTSTPSILSSPQPIDEQHPTKDIDPSQPNAAVTNNVLNPKSHETQMIDSVTDDKTSTTSAISSASPSTTLSTTTTSTPPQVSTTLIETTTKTMEPTGSVTLNDTPRINLTENLENKHIESFLAHANISTNEAQNFIKLVEKVLEQEVSKRVEKYEQDRRVQIESSIVPSKSDDSGDDPLTAEGDEDLVQPSLDSREPVRLINDEYSSNTRRSHRDEKVELKTVETRLTYSDDVDEKNAEDVDANDTERAAEVRGVPNFKENESSVLAIRDHILPVPKSHAYEDKKPVDYRLAQAGVATSDFKEREQAEFDNLIGKLQQQASAYPSPSSEGGGKATTPAPVQRTTFPHTKLMKNHAKPSHPHAMTQFERLVKDYQFRLSGQNGLNDLVKALRNANIGFYETPTYNRYNGRGNGGRGRG